MARKAVLEGGKRDEFLDKAIFLFAQNGYEGTSVRMILNEVGGEIGMFYHYFSSKEELFDCAMKRFMQQQGELFSKLLENDNIGTPKERLQALLKTYAESMSKFRALTNGTLHWSMKCTLHDLTVETMIPAVKSILNELCVGVTNDIEIDVLAQYVLKGISGVLHDENFAVLPMAVQYEVIIKLICRTLQIPMDMFTS